MQQQEDHLINYKHLIVNLFSLTLSNVLFYYELYPKETFEIKTVVSLQTHTLKQSVLLDYVVNLQEQIMKLFQHLTCIEIQLLIVDKPITSFMIHIGQDFKFLQSAKQFSVYEKDMTLKTATYQIHRFLTKQTKQQNKNLTFQVRFHTNGEEIQSEESQTNLTENWIRFEQQKQSEPQQQLSQEQLLIEPISFPGFNIGLSMKTI